MPTHSIFVFGLGYTSAGIARRAQHSGMEVTSTARQPARFAPLQTNNHRVVQFDPAARQFLDGGGMQALQSAQYVLTSISPVAAKLYDPVLAAQHRALRQAAEAGQPPAAVGYLSSTGVYGDWGGDWVDESSECRTSTARGLLRLEAEQAWVQLAQQLSIPLTIFRLGGIYGPNRSVLSNLQSQGPSRPSAERRSRQRFTSRCHVADVAQAVLADMQRRTQQQPAQQPWPSLDAAAALVDVLNVVDDEPAPRGDVEAYAGLLLQGQLAQGSNDAAAGAGSQPVRDSNMSSVAGSREVEQQEHEKGSQQQQQQQQARCRQAPLEEKRVRNDKLKRLLQAQQGESAGLLAPSYREGLALIMQGLTPFEQVDLDCLYSTL